MKIAVCTIAYNEAEHIRACVLNWKGKVDKHLVLVSLKPWNGSPVEVDETARIAKEAGAEVVIGRWLSEHDQRTWGNARLYDYDYVLVVDADELYTAADQETILRWIRDKHYDRDAWHNINIPIFECAKMRTYWKDHRYIFSPPDTHKPVLAVDPKTTFGYEHRNFKFLWHPQESIGHRVIIPVTCHHFSYAKSDAKIKEKIESFSHWDRVAPGWYENVWKKWEPGSDMLVRPYGHEPSKAVYDPAPQEIIDLLNA